MNRKKHIFIVLSVAIAIIVGTLVVKNVKAKVVDKNISVSQTDLGIPIELADVSKGDMIESINYIGTIVSKKSSVVSPAISGQIIEIYVEEGSMVQPGDLLAKLDDTKLVASLDTALKKVETLKTNYDYLYNEVANFYISNSSVKKVDTLTSNYNYLKGESEKYQQLYTEGAVSKTVYDKIKQETDTAYFQLEELKATVDDAYRKLTHEKDMTEKQLEEVNASINELNIKIEDTLVKSPIQGVVKKIYNDEGDLAVTGKPFADIDDNDEILIKVNISESDLNKISIGNKAVLKVKESNKEIVSEVSKIIPNVNPNTRVGVIEIGPIKTSEELKLVSGNSADVSIITNEARDRIIIPKNAIKNLGGENIVYLYQEEIVKEIKITTGLIVGENTEVVEGLKEGDKIAIKNLSKLYDNVKVYVFKGVDQ